MTGWATGRAISWATGGATHPVRRSAVMRLVVVVHSTGSKTAGLQLPPTPPKSRAAQSPKPPAGQPPQQGPTTGP